MTGILKTLLAGLALNAGYALVVLATLFFPFLCRRGTALWVLLATFAGLGAWFVVPPAWHLPHPVYYTLIAAAAAMIVVALAGRRRIEVPAAEAEGKA